MPDRPIRICYALNTFDLGGAETVALDLARSHDPTRFEVEAVAFVEPARTGEPEMQRRFREAGVRTTAIRQPSYRSPLALWRIYRYLRRGRFDVIVGHNRGADYWGLRLGKLAGIPHRFWTRHLVYNDMTPKMVRRYGWAARNADRVFAVSDTVRSACRDLEGIPLDKVETIVNGIDLVKYGRLDEVAKTRVRAALGLEPEQKFVLFVGRFSDQKAPEAFVSLVAAMRRADPGVRGFMCGYGPLAERLAARAGDGLEILGLRSDVPELLGACDLFVSTSRNEGLPLNVMEAMACGAAFVAPDISQIEELVAGDPGLEAQLYAAPPPSGDVPAAKIADWAALATATLADPGRCRSVGAAGRGVIDARFSLERMVRRYEEHYLSACGRSLNPKD